MNRAIAAAVAAVVLTSALVVAVTLADLPDGTEVEAVAEAEESEEAQVLAESELAESELAEAEPADPGAGQRRVDRPSDNETEGAAAIGEDARLKLRLPSALPPLHQRENPTEYLPPMSETRQMMGRIEKLMVSIRDEIRDARGDPGRIARALERFHATTHTDLQRAETLWAALEPDEKARFEQEMRARLWPVMHEIMGSMDKQGIPVRQVAAPVR